MLSVTTWISNLHLHRESVCVLSARCSGSITVVPVCLWILPVFPTSYHFADNLTSYHVISYNLFSFCGSVQDYKIHMDMEIVLPVT